MENLSFGQSSFIILSANTWDFPFYILQFDFRLKLIHGIIEVENTNSRIIFNNCICLVWLLFIYLFIYLFILLIIHLLFDRENLLAILENGKKIYIQRSNY